MNAVRALILLVGTIMGMCALGSLLHAEGSFIATGQTLADNSTATPTNDGEATDIKKVTNTSTDPETVYEKDVDYQVIHPTTGSAYVVFFEGHHPPPDTKIRLEGSSKEDGPHNSGGIDWS